MSILTHVTAPAHAFPEVWAWHTTVVVLAGVPAPSILSWVDKGALGPVM